MNRQQWYREVFLKSRYWKWVRRLVAQRAHLCCEVHGCPRRGWGLNAHHKRYRLYLEWLFLGDLVYLCPDHHAQTHSGRTLWLKPKFLFRRKLLPYS